MQKNIILIVVLVAMCLIIADTLIVRSKFDQLPTHQLNDSPHLILAHNLRTLFHQLQIPDSVYDDMEKFVKNDTQITKSITDKKPLSKASNDKVKNFFINNTDFQIFSVTVLTAKANNKKCMDDMKPETRKKLVKIILDQWDFSNIFLASDHDEEISKEQSDAIIKNLQSENDLKPYLKRCFGM